MAGESGFVTRAEFARIRGCGAPYVTKLGYQNRLVMDSAGKLIDVAKTIALLERTDDPARGGDRTGKAEATAPAPEAAARAPLLTLTGNDAAPSLPGSKVVLPAAGDTSAYKDAATRERIAKARLAELELAEKAGNLVRRDEVEVAVFGMARQAQEALDAIADRLSTQLAAESDPARVHQLLSEEVRRVMQQIAEARPLPALTAQQQPEQVAA